MLADNIKKNLLTKCSYLECILIKKNAFFFFRSDFLDIKKAINTSEKKYSIFLIIIPKKIGNSPQRNYMRRISKEIIWNNKLYDNSKFNFIFYIKKACKYDFLESLIIPYFKNK